MFRYVKGVTEDIYQVITENNKLPRIFCVSWGLTIKEKENDTMHKKFLQTARLLGFKLKTFNRTKSDLECAILGKISHKASSSTQGIRGPSMEGLICRQSKVSH